MILRLIRMLIGMIISAYAVWTMPSPQITDMLPTPGMQLSSTFSIMGSIIIVMIGLFIAFYNNIPPYEKSSPTYYDEKLGLLQPIEKHN